MSADHVGPVLRQFDSVRDLAFAAKGIRLTCGKGCSACCSEPLYATRQEAEFLWSKLTSEQVEALKPKLRVWRAKYAGAQLDADRLGEVDVIEYRKLDLVCPLLEGGLCSVYDHRPIGCRNHCAVGPRELCEDIGRRRQQRFVSVPEIINHFLPRIVGPAPATIEWTHLCTWLCLFAGVISPEEVVYG